MKKQTNKLEFWRRCYQLSYLSNSSLPQFIINLNEYVTFENFWQLDFLRPIRLLYFLSAFQPMSEPFHSCRHLPVSKNWTVDLSPATTVRPLLDPSKSWPPANFDQLLLRNPLLLSTWLSQVPWLWLSILSWSSCNNCVVFRRHWGTEFFLVAGVPLSRLIVHFSLQVLRLPELCLSPSCGAQQQPLCLPSLCLPSP